MSRTKAGWGISFMFTTDNGRSGEILFQDLERSHDVKGYNVEFDVDMDYHNTGGGDAFRIFSTVKRALMFTLKSEKDIKVLQFAGAKNPEEDTFGDAAPKGESRIRLYTRFAKQLARDYKFKLTTKTGGRETQFTLERP